ncbi:MAG: hypothetical protein NT031_18775 [Planctomycetota bacterium]|nr:hypothetical protein [Planctomycetota bacterium]
MVENKDRSIFRKNIGRAILNRADDPFLTQWNLDLLTRAAKNKHEGRIDWGRQGKIEEAVSAHIRVRCTFAVVEVGPQDRRLLLESRLISTVSLCEDCRPSGTWLGSSSPVEKIRESGLWLVNELYKAPLSDDDLATLERLARL